MEISSVIFIYLIDLTRSICEKCNYRPSGTWGTAIPVQRSHTELQSPVVELYNHKFIYNTKVIPMYGVCIIITLEFSIYKIPSAISYCIE